MIELICIRDVYKAKKGNVYYTDDDYYLLDNIDIIFIDEKTIDGYCIPLGVYQKKFFMTVAEYRESQIKSVIDDN
jgi:hypothetical protein